MSRRLLLLLLAPVGVLAGHLTGYASVGHVHAYGVSHSHLPFLAVLAIPLGLWALASCTRDSSRRLGRAAFSGLLGAQVVGYLGLEALEHAATTGSVLTAVTEPAVVAGLAAQLVAVLVLLAAVRGSQEARDGLRPLSVPLGVATSPAHWDRVRTRPHRSVHVAASRGRAPPPLLAT